MFTIADVPAGSHTVVGSYLGYNDVSQSIDVPATGMRPIELVVGAK